jgi:hypothetical protein
VRYLRRSTGQVAEPEPDEDQQQRRRDAELLAERSGRDDHDDADHAEERERERVRRVDDVDDTVERQGPIHGRSLLPGFPAPGCGARG